jgi:membrane protease YdiL (CAAX protease family)
MARALAASSPILLLTGLGAAVAIRVAVGAPQVAASQRGGVAFVAALALLLVAYNWKPGRLRPGSIAVGVVGAAVLIAGPLLLHLSGTPAAPVLPFSSFPIWAALVIPIAAAEEIILRGALFEACQRVAGSAGAVAVTSAAFALIHVPLYGPSALPLDLAVGMWLGGLRLLTGGVAAPATAHILADLCGWWLV